jgi:hypothetical protein
MVRSLNSWSWFEIQQAMKYYNNRFQEIKNLAERLEIKFPLHIAIEGISEMHPDRAEIVSRMFYEVKGMADHVDLLNREIKRRNALIGVIG